VIATLALVYPSNTSLAVTVLTYVGMVAIPIHCLTLQKSIRLYEVASLSILAIVALLLLYNYFAYDYFWSDNIFELSVFVIYSTVYFANSKIKQKVQQSESLKM
jgi:hypothetical protein